MAGVQCHQLEPSAAERPGYTDNAHDCVFLKSFLHIDVYVCAMDGSFVWIQMLVILLIATILPMVSLANPQRNWYDHPTKTA